MFAMKLACLNVPGGGLNKRRKFDDMKNVSQCPIDNLEKKVLGDNNERVPMDA